MTDSPDQPPKPQPEKTAQLAALVEEVPEEEAEAGAPDDEGADAAPGEEGAGEAPEGEDGGYVAPSSQAPLVSRAPPLLPKEKKQVRNRAVLIGGVVFVLCIVVAIGVVFAIGRPAPAPRVAQPTPPPVVTPPPVAAAPHPHTHITLDEIVFTSDGGPPAHP